MPIAWELRGTVLVVTEAGMVPNSEIEQTFLGETLSEVRSAAPARVLFEIATIGPGFTADEPFETLGESLSLPPNYERYREQVEQILAPLPNPRAARA